MHRTFRSFSVLQAIAAIAALAILLWSLGLPSIRFAEAANVTSFSDTLSDSAPSVGADHTITFVTPNGMAAGDIISLTFDAGFGNIDNLSAEDFDLFIEGAGEQTLATTTAGATWGVTAAGSVIDIESGSTAIASSATVTIQIGTNAEAGGTGNTQITNPATSTDYAIDLTVGSTDTGETRVAIVDNVTVTASVDTLFTFSVAGVVLSQDVNTADETSVASSPIAINYGELVVDTASTAAQDLTVTTNAANGFVVTVQVDQQLTSANGAVIDGFRNGTYDDTPVAWEPPGATPGSLETYGHWGITTNDASVGTGLTNDFNVGLGGDRFVSASTTPVEVFRHDGPTDGSNQGEGNTRVGYKVEISALQEAADDYTATLTYVATPVF